MKIAFTLLDAKGRVLATWTSSQKGGKVKITLALPAKARKPGRDTLKISTTGTGAKQVKTLPLVLRK